jgi:SM-20-related protein
MPPCMIVRDFLEEEPVDGLVDYAISHQADFTPTKLSTKGVDPSRRISVGMRELGKFRQVLEAKILGMLPLLVTKLGASPIEEPNLETELVAHGDGAFFKRHIDTLTTDSPHPDRARLLSGVYYFHAEPKAFTGGALRLFAIAGDAAENFVDIEPQRNCFLVFLSWAPHEVLPISCPSGRFIDSRFAINCWVHGRRPRASGQPRA